MTNNKLCFSMIAMVASLALANGASAQTAAATTATPPAKVYKSARMPGVFTGSKLDTIKYVPSCAKFTYNIDPVKIQESGNRAYVMQAAQDIAKADADLRALDTCLRENAQRDIDALQDILLDTISNDSQSEATKLSEIVAAFKANFPRVSAIVKKNDTVYPPFVNTYKAPEGRLVGSLSDGPVGTSKYSSGCGVYAFDITTDQLKTTTSRNEFNNLRERLLVTQPNLEGLRVCRNDNIDADYKALAKAINAGTADYYNDFANTVESKIAAGERQVAIQKQHLGSSGPAPKPAVKAAPKAKKK